jgi:hypothetical protein
MHAVRSIESRFGWPLGHAPFIGDAGAGDVASTPPLGQGVAGPDLTGLTDAPVVLASDGSLARLRLPTHATSEIVMTADAAKPRASGRFIHVRRCKNAALHQETRSSRRMGQALSDKLSVTLRSSRLTACHRRARPRDLLAFAAQEATTALTAAMPPTPSRPAYGRARPTRPGSSPA